MAKDTAPEGRETDAPDAGTEVDPDPGDPRHLADHRASLDDDGNEYTQPSRSRAKKEK